MNRRHIHLHTPMECMKIMGISDREFALLERSALKKIRIALLLRFGGRPTDSGVAARWLGEPEPEEAIR